MMDIFNADFFAHRHVSIYWEMDGEENRSRWYETGKMNKVHIYVLSLGLEILSRICSSLTLMEK